MFGERLALKKRLEQLDVAQEKMMVHFQEEREKIYNRLHKLDEEDFYLGRNQESEKTTETQINEFTDDTQQESQEEDYRETIKMMNEKLLEAEKVINRLIEDSDKTSTPQKEIKTKSKEKKARKVRKGKTSTSIDYEPAYKEAVEILKSHTASVSSVDLKNEIQKRTGVEIPNMTLFMNRTMKKDDNIEKPYRGQYVYDHEKSEINQNDSVNNQGNDMEQPDTNEVVKSS